MTDVGLKALEGDLREREAALSKLRSDRKSLDRAIEKAEAEVMVVRTFVEKARKR